MDALGRRSGTIAVPIMAVMGGSRTTGIALVGLDIAEGCSRATRPTEGKPVLRRKPRRDRGAAFFAERPPATVGIEACSTSHPWARTVEAAGHRARPRPPQDVEPFVERSKTDSADAEAIAEAMRRCGIRDVAIKSPERQAALAVHRARDLLVRQRTMLTNPARGFAAELGIVSAKGAWHAPALRARLQEAEPEELPETARGVLQALLRQFDDLDRRIEQLERQIVAWRRESEVSRRLAAIPGIGPIDATPIAATVPDASQLRSGRKVAARIGLVPRERSSGGKQRLCCVSKRGNPCLRRLPIVGAQAVLRWTRRGHGLQTPWLVGLMGRRPPNVVAVAIANEIARIAWAVMARGGAYRSAAGAAD